MSDGTRAPTPRRCRAFGARRRRGEPETRVGSITLPMLKALHRAHLGEGAEGVADCVRSLAAELDTSPAAVVRGVRVARGASSAEVAGWASAVIPYVDAAISLGALDEAS